jgi:NADP-dependent 3-hydroxy acid dehydrogenase YdfG
MDFKDRRVWISGASSGIGEALAVAFHQAGARLILAARREDELKRVQSACGGEPNTRILPMDVTNATELPGKTESALGMFGGVDILVLNAGITQRSLTRETDESVYRSLMEVNFFASEAMARAVLPSMLAQKSGHMVVISSVAGKFGVPLRSGYSASKFALHGFFEVLRAEEEKNGIHVTMVCPGYIRQISAYRLCEATAANTPRWTPESSEACPRTNAPGGYCKQLRGASTKSLSALNRNGAWCISNAFSQHFWQR